MSIGIDFILRANSAGFTQGLAKANNSLKGFKHSLREGDVGMGLKRLLGAGAIIEGFRLVINHAQETRKAFEEMGKSIPDNIASLARFGDAVDGIKKTAMDAGVSVVGFLTQVGEGIGSKINDARRAMGEGGLNATDVGDGGERAAQEQEAKRDAALKAQKERNSRENLQKQQKTIAQQARDQEYAGLGAMQKVNMLRDEENKLLARKLELMEAVKKGTADEAMLNDSRIALQKKTAEREAAEKTGDKRHDAFLPTVEGLAEQSASAYGNTREKAKAIMDARKVLELERVGAQQAMGGNFDLSDATFSQAGKLRAGLGGFTKSDEVSKGKDSIDAVAENTAEQVRQQTITNTVLSGLIKVSK